MTAALLVGPSLQVQAAKNDVILVEKGVALAVVLRAQRLCRIGLI